MANYAPHNDHPLEVRQAHWDAVEEIIDDTPASTALLLIGDMNAYATWDIDDANQLAYRLACPHTPTDPDDNSELLAALMRRKELCFPQTWMTKTHDQKWTHLRPTGEQVQIDHTIARSGQQHLHRPHSRA